MTSADHRMQRNRLSRRSHRVKMNSDVTPDPNCPGTQEVYLIKQLLAIKHHYASNKVSNIIFF